MRKTIQILILMLFSNSLFSQQQISICEETNNTFNYITSSGQPGSYTWLIDGGNISNDNDSVLTVDWNDYNLGIHTISVSFFNNSGCQSPSITYTVELIECPTTTMYAPNAFTPDGDENNNVWLPIGYNFTDFHFMIFDRWGELIFESYNEAFGWDGTYKGNMCQDGVYVYVLEWRDNKKRQHYKYGHVTLLK